MEASEEIARARKKKKAVRSLLRQLVAVSYLP